MKKKKEFNFNTELNENKLIKTKEYCKECSYLQNSSSSRPPSPFMSRALKICSARAAAASLGGCTKQMNSKVRKVENNVCYLCWNLQKKKSYFKTRQKW